MPWPVRAVRITAPQKGATSLLQSDTLMSTRPCCSVGQSKGRGGGVQNVNLWKHLVAPVMLQSMQLQAHPTCALLLKVLVLGTCTRTLLHVCVPAETAGPNPQHSLNSAL